jgi:hypothetical protein
MANRIGEIVPFSELEVVDVVERTFDDSYEAPYSYEADDDMLQALAQRFEFDMWTNKFPRES